MKSKAHGSYDILGVSYDEAEARELGCGSFGVVFRNGSDRVLKYPILYNGDDTEHPWAE